MTVPATTEINNTKLKHTIKTKYRCIDWLRLHHVEEENMILEPEYLIIILCNCIVYIRMITCVAFQHHIW